jgi:hypothetical protein
MTTTALFLFLCVFCWCAEPWALLEPNQRNMDE